MIRFEGNCTASVVRQAKYRLKRAGRSFKVEIVIETGDGERIYPASREHPELARMVNRAKEESGWGEAGQFYINEYRQVIVPAGNPVEYYYAGEYAQDIILELDSEQFSGRPLDRAGNLLKPGDQWSGRPRPGIKYKLKAGGADIEYEREISPGRTRVVRLSNVVGRDKARQTARKIAAGKGNPGGIFYVNEYRALFGPVTTDDMLNVLFFGVLSETDPWFPKWVPPAGDGAGTAAAPVPVMTAGQDATVPTSSADGSSETMSLDAPTARTVEIEEGSTGYTYDQLFAPYIRGASEVTVEDPYTMRPHQVANFLRFCEMCVRLGDIRKIALVTSTMSDEIYSRMVSVKKSLAGLGIELELNPDDNMHDRRIVTNHGWAIHPGRGLDIYKRPEDFYSVGASDFALRPCFKTRIIYQRTGNGEADPG